MPREQPRNAYRFTKNDPHFRRSRHCEPRISGRPQLSRIDLHFTDDPERHGHATKDSLVELDYSFGDSVRTQFHGDAQTVNPEHAPDIQHSEPEANRDIRDAKHPIDEQQLKGHFEDQQNRENGNSEASV